MREWIENERELVKDREKEGDLNPQKGSNGQFDQWGQIWPDLVRQIPTGIDPYQLITHDRIAWYITRAGQYLFLAASPHYQTVAY